MTAAPKCMQYNTDDGKKLFQIFGDFPRERNIICISIYDMYLRKSCLHLSAKYNAKSKVIQKDSKAIRKKKHL